MHTRYRHAHKHGSSEREREILHLGHILKFCWVALCFEMKYRALAGSYLGFGSFGKYTALGHWKGTVCMGGLSIERKHGLAG